jgi:hypothetical protein
VRDAADLHEHADTVLDAPTCDVNVKRR